MKPSIRNESEVASFRNPISISFVVLFCFGFVQRGVWCTVHIVGVSPESACRSTVHSTVRNIGCGAIKEQRRGDDHVARTYGAPRERRRERREERVRFTR